MDARSFEALVVEAVESLPGDIKRKFENIDVVIEDEPTAEHRKSGGSKEGGFLMGLYQGVPLSKRTHFYGEVLPDKITIFKNKEAVRRTVIHEFAHQFGISDEHMKRSGTY